MPDSCIVLASASPRRAELLSQIGVRFESLPQDIDESAAAHESPEQLVMRLAREKALAVLSREEDRGRVVLGSDTLVVHRERVMAQPRSRDEALMMLSELSGSRHRVLTAVCVANQEKTLTELSATHVQFRPISEHEAAAYWETGEPPGKAGAYAIQGLGAVFVQSIEGSYSGVMGLPLFETASLLNRFDIPCWLPQRPP